MMLRLDHTRFLDDARASLAFLKSFGNESDRVAVTGFCMGGGLTFLTACRLSSEITAAAPFYGIVLDEWIEEITEIEVPVYLFFGAKDPVIPQERVRQVDSRFRELGKNYRLKVYPDADHGFFCNERESYNRAAVENA